MGHFARVIGGYVDWVIVAEQEDIDSGRHGDPAQWIQTSYNTKKGTHYITNTRTPSEDQSKALRKNFAGIGYMYDPTRDAFIPPKPYPSWVLNETECWWYAPIPAPADEGQTDSNGRTISYIWDEENQTWVNPNPPE